MNSIKQIPNGARVLVRVDYNVPLNSGKITENSKIEQTIPTISLLLQKRCKVIIATHLGRPKGKYTKELRTACLVKELKAELKNSFPKVKITKFSDCIGETIRQKIISSDPGIFLLENLRFYSEEEKNDICFAHFLANLADYYVNDAFAVSHRKHASISALARFLKPIPGLLMEKEVENLSKALKPKRPAVWLIGGGKLDKVGFLQKIIDKADYVLIGGVLPFPFMKALGLSVGMSKVDLASVKVAKKILQKPKNRKKLILPIDFRISTSMKKKMNGNYPIREKSNIKSGEIALDLGPETVKLFQIYLRKAHTIVWNGPLGNFEWEPFAYSTKEIGRFIGKLTADTICGGGETSEALRKFHLTDRMTHVSTGGGAALAFLAGEKLPGLKFN